MYNPKPNEIYRHFKGNLYQIITLATHSETGEEMVVYQALYGQYQVYVRPLAMFLSPVDLEKYPDAQQKLRFEPIPQLVGQQAAAVASAGWGKEQAAGQNEEQAVKQATEQTKEAETQMYTESVGAAEQNDAADEEAALRIDPLVMEFLESHTYEEKLRILTALHPRITDDMINTMAAAIDVEVNDGELEQRYGELKACLLTFDKFECTRLR